MVGSSKDIAPLAASKSWHSSLRSLLGVVMVGLLLAVSGSLITLDYYRARNTAIETAESHMRAFEDRLVSRMQALSGDTSGLVNLIVSIANSFLAPPSDRVVDKVAILRAALARSPQIDGVYAGYPDGGFFHAVNLTSADWRTVLDAPPNASIAVRILTPTAEGPLTRILFFDAAGKQLLQRTTTGWSYDPRQRPWYRAAAGGTGPTATGPYRMATTGMLGMTISQAHKSNPEIVIGADVVLDRIIHFIASERLTPSAVAFVIDADRQPILHSDRRLMQAIAASKSERDFDPANLRDPLLEAIKANPPALNEMGIVDVAGRQWVVMGTQVDAALLFAGDIAVIAAPVDELMATARAGLYQGLLLSAAIVLLAIAGALVVAHLITKSLHQLTASANRMQDLDFSTPIEVPTRVSEIATLGGAMNRARDAIFTFALYVPREVVRRAIASGDFAGRTARRQEVTAIFTDIYDFTTISEQHSPEEVVGMLSEYFDILNGTVNAHGGTIIQFLGDSIFAMWNAPAPDPHHAENACRGALAMKERLAVFNERQRNRGLPEFRTRFGIHTGTAVVGSVGAKDRLQYTAMGDSINVASRLEGMNKGYGTTILASGAVVAQCRDRIQFRPLGEGQAKGRATALELYEVIGVAAAAQEIEAGGEYPRTISSRP
ncbi:adenylate/guanylate cyclase domain-containing protein [Mycoplana dimorpha]|uniref:Adenylate cyclase n=1 Tax=Mycoplana dimorpha TaxID=28320 RepID=A0A2T5AXD3_MYCDI|nr:adenylate/guanylate cyclase domain-containing protein [Mycoplana dimorpha]PTM91401.1 adenylate cyclase [Mycoplana dimorpha]